MTDAVDNTQIPIGQQAEVNTMKAVDKIETSNFGKVLPTEINNVYVSDIVKWLMVANFSNYLPMFVIFSRSLTNYFEWLRIPINVAFNISYIALFIISAITFLSGLQEFYKFVVLATLVKEITVAVLIVMATFGQHWIDLLMGIVYVCYTILLDVVFLYYLAIYLKRTNSSEYDDLGVRIENNDDKV